MSSETIIRSYRQGDIKNGQLFDENYIDTMETGIENSYKYSNFLEKLLLPQKGELPITAELTKPLEVGIYELNSFESTSLPISPMTGILIQFSGAGKIQMAIGGEVQAYYRIYNLEQDNFSNWVTFELYGSAEQALTNAKKYTDEKMGTVDEIVSQAAITIDQLVPGSQNSTIPANLLPSYVDDIEDYESLNDFPMAGESGKIYLDTSTNLVYRWGGDTYVEISPSLALGTTSSTAFRGNLGQIAYDHANSRGVGIELGLYKIATNDQGHVSLASEIKKEDIIKLGIPEQDTTYSIATTTKDGLVPKLVTAQDTINNIETNSVLTNNNGVLGWYKLPLSIFNGSNIEVEQILTSGIEIGAITVDGTRVLLYAPKGGDESTLTPISDAEIDEICILPIEQ